MVARAADVEQGVEVGGLSAAGEHGAHTALQGSNLAGHGVVGRVLQTGIEIALLLQVEEVGHFFGVVILESGALIDGQHPCLSIFWLPSSLNAEGCRFQ